MNLIKSQMVDALAYMDALEKVQKSLSDDPTWGGGMHLVLPRVIPLRCDVNDDDTVYAWLVVNDFEGYDLALEDPRA